jgi:hypothetical protein
MGVAHLTSGVCTWHLLCVALSKFFPADAANTGLKSCLAAHMLPAMNMRHAHMHCIAKAVER